MEKKKFNVLIWDFNRDELEHYDVLPYLRNRYEERVERLASGVPVTEYSFVPKSLSEFKKFVDDEARYQFWARCEYEVIVHGWPVQKNDYKLDVYEQVKMNLDIIAEILYQESLEKTEEC